ANISQEEYAARIEELQSEKEEIESQLRYLYENEDDITYNVAGGFYEYEVDDMVSLVNWSPTSGLMNSIVIFNGKYQDMTFESTIDTGRFMVNNNPGFRRIDEKYTFVSNETFYWVPGPGLTEHAFMDTIAKSGDKIVGYSIIEITLRKLAEWMARVVKSAYVYDFENDEGITYEQVKAAIYEAKIGLPYGRVLTFDREAVNYNEEIELYELEVDDLIVEGPTTNSVTIKYNDPYTQFYGELDLGYMGYTRIMSARKMNYLPGDSIYWHHSEDVTGTGEAYIDLIIKSEEKIIGYAVVKVDYWGETEEEQGHSFTVLKSVLFPALDGIFQKVTEEQVRSAIDQVKGSVT
ncbi:MAG: hypothetical protein J6Y43_02300, partial [Clostridia bacterium]|nr:hypothetical protein [Clostridia bacterium]